MKTNFKLIFKTKNNKPIKILKTVLKPMQTEARLGVTTHLSLTPVHPHPLHPLDAPDAGSKQWPVATLQF